MIRVFVGTTITGDEDAELALAYSIHKNCSEPVEIEFMRPEGWDRSNWGTPFSGMRWTIAERCGYKGKAIYLDVDMLVLGDLAEMWHTDLQGKTFAAVADRSCSMLIDCEKFPRMTFEEMKQDPKFHTKFLEYFKANKTALHHKWNVLDGKFYEKNPEKIGVLHFTSVQSQPWEPSWWKKGFVEHPRPFCVELWEKYFNEALNESD